MDRRKGAGGEGEAKHRDDRNVSPERDPPLWKAGVSMGDSYKGLKLQWVGIQHSKRVTWWRGG